MVAVLLAGVIPLLLGLLFELVVVAPLRVQLDQTPLFYPWQVGGWRLFALVLWTIVELWCVGFPPLRFITV